jgi:hypothetical protein
MQLYKYAMQRGTQIVDVCPEELTDVGAKVSVNEVQTTGTNCPMGRTDPTNRSSLKDWQSDVSNGIQIV